MNGGQPCLHHTLPKAAGGGFILTHAVQIALDRALHPYGIDGGALHGRGGTEPPEAADHGLAGGFVIVALIQSGHEQTRGKGVLFHGFSPFLTAVVGSCRFFQYTTSQKGEKAQTKTVMIGRRGKFRVRSIPRYEKKPCPTTGFPVVEHGRK
jgi:hypothetical protein